MINDEIFKMQSEIVENYKKLFTEESLLNFIAKSKEQGLDPKYCLINDAALKLIFPFHESGDLIFNGVTFQPSKYAEFEIVRFALDRFDIDPTEFLNIEFND